MGEGDKSSCNTSRSWWWWLYIQVPCMSASVVAKEHGSFFRFKMAAHIFTTYSGYWFWSIGFNDYILSSWKAGTHRWRLKPTKIIILQVFATLVRIIIQWTTSSLFSPHLFFKCKDDLAKSMSVEKPMVERKLLDAFSPVHLVRIFLLLI